MRVASPSQEFTEPSISQGKQPATNASNFLRDVSSQKDSSSADKDPRHISADKYKISPIPNESIRSYDPDSVPYNQVPWNWIPGLVSAPPSKASPSTASFVDSALGTEPSSLVEIPSSTLQTSFIDSEFVSPSFCERCHFVYKNNSHRRKHILTHIKTHMCPHKSCTRHTTGFATPNDLDRHVKCVHKSGLTDWWKCDYPGCHKTSRMHFYDRKDNFITHIKRRHQELKTSDIEELVNRSRHTPTPTDIQAAVRAKEARPQARGRRSSSKATTSRRRAKSDTIDLPLHIQPMSQSQHIFSVESGAELMGQWATTKNRKGDSLAGLGPLMSNFGQTEIDLPSEQLHQGELALPTHSSGTPAGDWTPDSSSTSNTSSSDTESDVNPQVLDFLKTRLIEEVQDFRAHTTGRPQRDDLYQTVIEAQDQTPGATEYSKTKGTALPSASSSSNNANLKHGRDISEDFQAKNDKCKSRKLNMKPDSGDSGKRLAYLYHKYRPLVYRKNDQTGMMFDCCATSDFENMHRLYQHLMRCHYESPYQCITCGDCFVDDPEEYDSHIYSRACEPKQHVRILYTTQRNIDRIKEELMTQSYGRGSDEEAKWRFVFGRLFHVSSGSTNPHLGDVDITLVSLFGEYISDRVAELPAELPILPSRVEDLIRGFLREFGLQHGIPGIERTQSTPPVLTPPESGSSSSEGQSSLDPAEYVPGQERQSTNVFQGQLHSMAVSAGEPSSETINFDTSYLDTHGTDMPLHTPLGYYISAHGSSGSADAPQSSHDSQAPFDLLAWPQQNWSEISSSTFPDPMPDANAPFYDYSNLTNPEGP